MITNFLTSCRVLGRNVENIFLKRVVKKLYKKDTKIFIEFIKSQKNQLAKKFIIQNKFKLLDKKGKKNADLNIGKNFYLINEKNEKIEKNI